MTRRTPFTRTAAALRELDPAATTTLSDEGRRRADALLARVVATPDQEHDETDTAAPRRGRRVLLPVALVAATAVALSTALGGSAFADWTAKPATLPPASAAVAATTCRSALDVVGRVPRIVIGERRGGWTYVLLDGPGEEGACLLPDALVGTSGDATRTRRFFGSYDPESPIPPTPPRDSIVETESMTGAVSVPGRLPFRTVDGWFVWVTGYAGPDVTRVTVDPPMGPDVEASLHDGRFAAWWPAGDEPGTGEAWGYTLTLADGTTRRV